MDERDVQALLHEKYEGVETAQYETDKDRLAEGEPVDYVVGWKPFLDCKIFLDSRPLIPRSETEYWVEKAILEIRRERGSAALACLDLFAGSGAIGVAVLKHLPNARIDFGEIDAAHFPTILKNIRENLPTPDLRQADGVNEMRARTIKTDVWSAIAGTYDFVFANPPYLSEARRKRIQKSVLAYEPASALFARENGLELIRKTIQGAAEYLRKDGAMYLEHEPEQAEAVIALAVSNRLSAKNRTDQFGVLRYSVLHMA
ncbi:MAG: HemK/PrmC family methyltransferase [bacterium]|nr:HemK/PrmC family methyltransferase [bacterium]